MHCPEILKAFEAKRSAANVPENSDGVAMTLEENNHKRGNKKAGKKKGRALKQAERQSPEPVVGAAIDFGWNLKNTNLKNLHLTLNLVRIITPLKF